MTSFLRNPYFLATLTGLGLWISFPGGGEIWPMLGLALVPLLFGIQASPPRQAALCGLIGGLVHFLLLLYWIIIVLGTYGGLAWYFSVPALLLLALYMSLYFSFFALLAQFILNTFPAIAVLWLLPALWVGLDWLRSVLFTGFPWMDLGYALYKIPIIIQIADLAGHHGVTYLIIFINTLLFLLLKTRISVRGTLLLLVPACLLLGCAGIYSQTRFAETNGQMAASSTPQITIGIVQGNIDQSIKWSPSQQSTTVQTYLTLSKSLITSRPPSLIVWPETALPFYPLNGDHTLPLRKLVEGRDLALLTGAPWYEILDYKTKKVRFFNSALLLKPDGQFHDKYYKVHLVPFGEYVPLKQFLPFLAPLVEAVGDFSAGTIEQPLAWKDAKTGILICFESVFPEISRQWVKAGANILINLTNDAWYGKSSAPYHSLAMAVFRAVETRRSLIRSANTGISAFVTPAGTIDLQSEIFIPWAAARAVTLMTGETFWVRYGYLFAPVCLTIGLFCSCLAIVRRRRETQSADNK
ncbi:MAG: apolipoprotein N-acyltransferase [Proteobacteria bacterium]|nr:apolipoprotein N-acyltransferase [Pseudomonadota bacterium]